MTGQHYDDLEWIEYLKGGAGERTAAMATHAESCDECRAWLSTCRQLMHVFGAESASNQISQWIHHAVKNFSPQTRSSPPQEVFAGLKSDTYLETPLGVRSAMLSERRVSFESDGYALDMTAEVSHRTLRRVVGHLRGKDSQTPAAGIAAELRIAAKTYSTETDVSGEFYFSTDEELSGDPVEIRFRFGENLCLTALLPF